MSIWYSTTSSHLNISAKVKQVTSQNGLKDGREILGTRHDAAQDGEMPLETLTDGERSGGGVHGGEVLGVDELFFQGKVLSVVEGAIAQVLWGERERGGGSGKRDGEKQREKRIHACICIRTLFFS